MTHPPDRLADRPAPAADQTAAAALASLRSSADDGLSADEAADRLRRDGPNDIPEPRSHPLLDFARKFWGLSAWMIELIAALSSPSARQPTSPSPSRCWSSTPC